MSKSLAEEVISEKRVDPSFVLLDEICGRLGDLAERMDRQTPEGIVEPINPFTATSEATVIQPPFRDKHWFSVTIVKEAAVELHIIINTGKSGTTPYTMGTNEKVYDQDFNIPCIYDIMVWTNEDETCTVKIRGSR